MYAIVGASLNARHSSALRSLAATPKSRVEAEELRSSAFDALGIVRLDGFADTRAELLDGFQQRLLMLASAVAARPRLLLLDEPSAGAAVADVHHLAEILGDVRASGISLVVVEHNLPFVRTVADRVIVMADGRGQDESLS